MPVQYWIQQECQTVNSSSLTINLSSIPVRRSIQHPLRTLLSASLSNIESRIIVKQLIEHPCRKLDHFSLNHPAFLSEMDPASVSNTSFNIPVKQLIPHFVTKYSNIPVEKGFSIPVKHSIQHPCQPPTTTSFSNTSPRIPFKHKTDHSILVKHAMQHPYQTSNPMRQQIQQCCQTLHPASCRTLHLTSLSTTCDSIRVKHSTCSTFEHST